MKIHFGLLLFFIFISCVYSKLTVIRRNNPGTRVIVIPPRPTHRTIYVNPGQQSSVTVVHGQHQNNYHPSSNPVIWIFAGLGIVLLICLLIWIINYCDDTEIITTTSNGGDVVCIDDRSYGQGGSTIVVLGDDQTSQSYAHDTNIVIDM